jgi:hypothetical protein
VAGRCLRPVTAIEVYSGIASELCTTKGISAIVLVQQLSGQDTF